MKRQLLTFGAVAVLLVEAMVVLLLGTNAVAAEVETASANDVFSAATVLVGSAGSVSGSNVGATVEPNEPSHGGSASHSVWWAYTAPADGRLELDLNGSVFASSLSVYEGGSVDDLRQVAVRTHTQAGGAPSMTLQAIGGTTYRIAIDGEGASTGAITLGHTFTDDDSVTAAVCDRWASSQGSDANSGTQAAPKKTVQGLARILAPGQTGCLAAGTIIDGTGGFGIVDAGGTPWNPITIRTEPGGARATLRGFFQVNETVSDIVFQDVAMETPAGVNANLIVIWGDRVTVRDSDLTNRLNICLTVGRGQSTAAGQTLIAADDVLILNNVIHDCAADRGADVASGWHGMYIQEGARTRVLHNTVALNLYRGIQLYPNPKDAEVAFNVFDRNGTNVNLGSFNDGATSFFAEDADVHHNILTNATLFDPPKNQANLSSTGIFQAGADYGNAVSDNCSFFSDPLLNGDPNRHFVGNGHNEVSNTIDDPGFADPLAFDYRLSPSSPCEGKGPASIQPSGGPVAWDGTPCTIFGTEGSEVLEGTESADVICGLGGDDLIRPRGGFDKVDGGGGMDQLDYGTEPVGLFVNLTNNDVYETAPVYEKYDQLNGFEAVLGTDHDDTLIGSASADLLVGRAGSDTITGLDGDDIINEGAANSGSDSIHGNGGTDTVDYSGRLGPVTVTTDGVADDGASGEGDNVFSDVENVEYPSFGAVASDFDGDGASDVAVFRPGGSGWFVQGGLTTSWGAAADVPVAGDFNGDGIVDVAVFRPSDHTWYVQPSASFPGGLSTQWGVAGDVPIPADFNGDGVTDIAVFRPSDQTWYAQPSVTLPAGLATQWGIAGDLPIPVDFDGDGSDEVAVFRPADQTWYSQDGLATQWGVAGDIPVPVDFDGDGSDEVAVFRPSDQTWYSQGSPLATQWGVVGDMAVPGDYDGDGDGEVAVFRPSDQTWYVQGGLSTQWGATDDVPVIVPHALRDLY